MQTTLFEDEEEINDEIIRVTFTPDMFKMVGDSDMQTRKTNCTHTVVKMIVKNYISEYEPWFKYFWGHGGVTMFCKTIKEFNFHAQNACSNLRLECTEYEKCKDWRTQYSKYEGTYIVFSVFGGGHVVLFNEIYIENHVEHVILRDPLLGKKLSMAVSTLDEHLSKFYIVHVNFLN